MRAVGEQSKGPGRIYLTGGATSVLRGWRDTTIDIDVKPEPEPPGFFEAVVRLKESLGINVELASPDDFIPALPGWRERGIFVARHGEVEFFHYDPYGQVLAKLQRGHDRDLRDARDFVRDGLVEKKRLLELFESIAPRLLRYPAIDPPAFRAAVKLFFDEQG